MNISSDPREDIRERIYADIRKRVYTYLGELNSNLPNSSSFETASETFRAFAPYDMKFLCDERERLMNLLGNRGM